MNDLRRLIFEHTDVDDDSLSLEEYVMRNGNLRLIAGIQESLGGLAEVALDRDEVIALRDALDTWLHPRPSPDGDVWGTRIPCTGCGHAEGVHTVAQGCHAVLSDGYTCDCIEYSRGTA